MMDNRSDNSTQLFIEVEAVLDRKLGPLVDKLNEVLKSISFLDSKFEELRSKQTNLQIKNKELTATIQFLQEEVKRLNTDVIDLKMAKDEQEQYDRRECLEIKGIPVTPDEDTDKIVMNLASKIGVDVKESDLSVSHRNPGPYQGERQTPVPIIVKFTRRVIRDKVYQAKSKLKHVTTRDLGFTRFRDSKIYITESLTKPRKALYKECLKFKKEQKYDFLWTRYGRIYLRESRDERAIEITSTEQLNNLY